MYARISAGFDWIEANVCELSEDPPATFHCTKKPSRITEQPTPTEHPTISVEHAVPEVEPIQTKQSGHSWLTWVVVIAVFCFGYLFLRTKRRTPKELAPADGYKEDRAKLTSGYGSIEAA